MKNIFLIVLRLSDLHTSYWREYGGGLKKSKSFVNKSKDLIDELNGHWVRGRNRRTYFTDNTLSINFYDSVIVFEKGIMPKRSSIKCQQR